MGRPRNKSIGKTFNNGTLVVVEDSVKQGYVKVKCSVCSEDSELFGDGVFETQFGNLTEGRIPCGCSGTFRWSLNQYEIRIRRKIVDECLPVMFIGFVNTGKSIRKTSVKLLCINTSTEFTISRIDQFFSGGGNFGKSCVVLDRISKYNVDNPDYIVWDTKTTNTKGNPTCGFYCKICESKGFESLFKINTTNLFMGKIPCYCSMGKGHITGDHVSEVAKTLLHEEGQENVEVIGAYENKKYWYVVFMCSTHGVYSRAYSSVKKHGCKCLKCEVPKSGYDKTKKGYFYLLSLQTNTGFLLGYGITSNISNRVSSHKRNLKSIGATITNIKVFEGSGTAVLSVENAIKSLHKTGLLDCEGFRRESISIDRKDEVLELCKKLKELDNTKETI